MEKTASCSQGLTGESWCYHLCLSKSRNNLLVKAFFCERGVLLLNQVNIGIEIASSGSFLKRQTCLELVITWELKFQCFQCSIIESLKNKSIKQNLECLVLPHTLKIKIQTSKWKPPSSKYCLWFYSPIDSKLEQWVHVRCLGI